MADQDANVKIEEFMRSPVMTWFSSCLEDSIKHQVTFDEVVDGVLIYSVFLKMDIHGHINDVAPPNGDDVQRLRNLQVIMDNMRLFYEEDCVVLQEPELSFIARAAHTNIREVQLLLVLLLGCAVKCPNKRIFIERIQALDNDTQKGIMSHLEKITEFPDIVLCRDMLLVETSGCDYETELKNQSPHTQKVYKAFEEIRRINKERIELIAREESTPRPKNAHCLQELTEWKSKALRLQVIEDEYFHELQSYAKRLEIAEKDNLRLVSEAKAVKEYRDELDIAREKVLQAERLEREVARYKEKLEKYESYKARLEELKRDNELLIENKDELVEEVDFYKAKVDEMLNVDQHMYKLQQQCDKLTKEKEKFKQKIDELNNTVAELEDIVELTKPLKSSSATSSSESLDTVVDCSIQEQLSCSTTSEALQLQIRNRRLCKLTSNFSESLSDNNSMKIVEFEEEYNLLQRAHKDMKTKVEKFEENLAAVNEEKLQLQASLEQAQKIGSEMEFKIVTLELQKKEALRELERTQQTLTEKNMLMDNSSKIINELQMKLQTSEKPSEQELNDSNDELNSSNLSPSKQTILCKRLKNDYASVCHERNIVKLRLRNTQVKLKRQSDIVAELESTIKSMQVAGSPTAPEFSILKRNYNDLMSKYRKTKSASDELTKRLDENQRMIRSKDIKIIGLQFDNAKLKGHCKALTILNDKAELDKQLMMEFGWMLMKKNQDLMAKAIEDKEHFYEEEKKINEVVKNLYRAKEKLENKIIDQFRHMENKRRFKKRSGAINAMKNTFNKVRRAGSELLERSRASWSGNNSCPTERCEDFEFSRPSDQGTSANLRSDRIPDDFFGDFQPEIFSFGAKKNGSS